jgi:putative endonuclease
MPNSPFYVYIMANSIHNVLYTGQTNDLLRRVWAHKQGLVEGFTRRYKINKLVYYEVADNRDGALFREKQIKGYSRTKKVTMIEKVNPGWQDLYLDMTRETD